MLTSYINTLMQAKDLTSMQCQAAFKAILDGANDCQIAAFLALLHAKGETKIELAAAVNVLRNEMIAVPFDVDLIDLVGTGGDGAHTINISTAASLVVASCGVKVAKHGNRSVSSQCGSADFIEKLGVNIHLSASEVAASIQRCHIGFCFAPTFHPMLGAVKDVRRKLAVRTTFNLLGPLLNPARANYYLLGVAKPNYLSLFADVLVELSMKHALVVHGCGLDELSCLGPAMVVEVRNKKIKEYQIDPKDYGFQYCELQDLQGGDATENVAKILAVFHGEKNAIADTIALNAGAALYIVGKVESIHAGVMLACQQLRNGEVLNLLQQWKAYVNGRCKNA